uniref:Neuralized-like protein 4-like n=1 Tax=Saccoglossus kowalevskii TaxID=10224 RepID=A0ABM0MK03_SACKO|nr:PREDICTED: neuralized-like protein 4-like [Saccoglossus kowalevskii]
MDRIGQNLGDRICGLTDEEPDKPKPPMSRPSLGSLGSMIMGIGEGQEITPPPVVDPPKSLSDRLFDMGLDVGPSHGQRIGGLTENQEGSVGSFSFPLPTHQTYYTLASVCGDNADVSCGGKRAVRKDGEKTENFGVVMTEQNMQDGKPFDVRLDRKNSKWAGSFEIGITTLNQNALPSLPSIYRSKEGITYLWSGKHILKNGVPLQEVEYDLDDSTIGDIIGIRKEGTTLHFYMNGKRLPNVVKNVTVGSYRGVVDIYGEAEEITIMGHNRPVTAIVRKRDRNKQHKELTYAPNSYSVMMGMRSTIDLLNTCDIDIPTAGTEIKTTIIQPYIDEREHHEKLEQFGDHLADLDAARAFTSLTERILAIPDRLRSEDVWSGLFNVRIACWNYTNVSRKMSVQLVKEGLIPLLLSDLREYGFKKSKKERVKFAVLSSLNILHNCARPAENYQAFSDSGAVDGVLPFLKSDDKEYVMVAALTLSYISDPEKMDQVEFDTKAVKHIFKVLGKALDSPDLCCRGNESGYYVVDLVQGLSNLADNERNKVTFLECGVMDLVVQTLKKCGQIEQEHAANIVWKLAQHDASRLKIEKNATAMDAIMKCSESTAVYVREAADRAVMALKPFRLTKQDIGFESSQPQCEYMDLCKRYLDTLKIPKEFFNPKFDLCYCNKCHTSRGDALYYVRGEPGMVYGIPITWCRFALNVHQSRVDALQVFDKWHIAYHGTQAQTVSDILKTGELLIAGDVGYGGKQIKEGEGHYHDGWKPHKFDTKNIFLSPTIRYAGLEAYSKPFRYRDRKTGKTYTAKASFQVCIRPHSYRVGKQTVGATFVFDPKINNNECEWYTKERGAIILYGLLINVREGEY